jgi:hypothetical protein
VVIVGGARLVVGGSYGGIFRCGACFVVLDKVVVLGVS